MEKRGYAPDELLMVDDLKPGLDMSRAAGVRFAAAGWARQSKKIEEFMRHASDIYLENISELEAFLFNQ